MNYEAVYRTAPATPGLLKNDTKAGLKNVTTIATSGHVKFLGLR